MTLASPERVSALAKSLRLPYRLALATPPLTVLGGALTLTLSPPPLAPAQSPDDLHALLSATSVGAAFAAMLLSRALLSPARAEEAEDPARYVWGVCVLTWALCALGAGLGLVLCAQTGRFGDLAPAASLSLLTTLAHPPTEPRLRAALGGRR
jgi:integral membrane sensor domain MASE1